MYPYDARPPGSAMLARPGTLRILVQVSWRNEVKRLLDVKGIVYDDIRHIFGVKTKGAVGHHLTGRRRTTVEQFFALAKYLGVSAEDLFHPSDPGQEDPDPVSFAGIDELPPDDRRHLQAVIKKFIASPAWDKKTERRKTPRTLAP